MDDTLFGQISLGGAVLVAASYFLPWMSMLTPMGTVQFRGQFLDYAWVLLALSLAYLMLLFVGSYADGLGIPPPALPKIQTARLVIPSLLLGFLVWAGSNFELGLHFGHLNDLFDTDTTDSNFRAGLDYGYWLGLLGAGALVAATAAKTRKLRVIIATTVTVAALALICAYAKNLPSKVVNAPPVNSTPTSGSSPSSSAIEGGSAPSFDSSPYVGVDSVSGVLHSKNYEESRYNDSLDIRLVFKNLTDKIIVGLRGRVEVLDAFGNTVYDFTFRDDDKIPAKASESSGGAYNFEHNQFEDDDPYSKMYPLVLNGTAKYKVTVYRIAFADGTILPNE